MIPTNKKDTIEYYNSSSFEKRKLLYAEKAKSESFAFYSKQELEEALYNTKF